MYQRKTHCGVHNARAVRPDGVCNVTDVDGVKMLVVACLFYENLQGNFSSEPAVHRAETTGALESYLVV